MDKTPTAFPWTHDNITCTGMTLRDYFAAKAMPVAMETLRQDWTKDLGEEWYWDHSELEILAEHSYYLADAMLKAREA
jgi:hypothetical protein